MLTNVGNNDRFSVRETPQIIDDMRRIQAARVWQALNVANSSVSFQFVDMGQPVSMLLLGQTRQ